VRACAILSAVQIPRDLRLRLDAVDGPLADPSPLRHAAVLAPLLPGTLELGPRLLLIERAGNLRAHAGQLAFPGGKPEPTDRDLLETALREAEEEVALPRAQVEILGRLAPVPVPSGFMVVPYVGLVHGPWQPRIQDSEVKSVLTPSLLELCDPALYRLTGHHEWRGIHYALHEYRIHEPPLWGATARMVFDLLARMGHAPDVAP
jgi:8-oxo-dGTP pyrophosphatase MutT (NUDIX family)